MAVTPDGRRAVSGSDDKTLKVWDLDSGAELRTLEGHDSSVNAVPITPDGRRVLSASDDHTCKLWDVSTGQVLATFTGDSAMTACAAAPGNHTFIAGETSGRLHFLTLIEPSH